MSAGAKIAAVVVAVVLLFVGIKAVWSSTEETVTIEVVHTERVTSQNSNGDVESKYLVFTEEGETFENTDSALYAKFDSSDLHGQLSRGGLWECKVYGYRLKFFSSYRNIIDCTPLGGQS